MNTSRKLSNTRWRNVLVAVASGFVLLSFCRPCFAWGQEGHAIVALIAEHDMSHSALARARTLLGGATLDEVSHWADDYRTTHPETAPWHHIFIPLADSRIDMTRECPDDNCVVGKIEEFLAVLRNPKATRTEKADALKFVIHFIGDMHQPLHDGEADDNGGTARRVVFEDHPNTLHHVWDIDLLEQINRNAEAFAAQLESRITQQDRGEWIKGSVADWALQGHRLAQTVCYKGLGSGRPPTITSAYEHKAYPVIEIQLEKGGVRLAYLLDEALK